MFFSSSSARSLARLKSLFPRQAEGRKLTFLAGFLRKIRLDKIGGKNN